MAMASFGGMSYQGMAGNEAAFMGMDFGSDEDYLSDEEFQKSLTEQEKTIFNALVISISQTHMIRQKNF